jgi:hypothetical protein
MTIPAMQDYDLILDTVGDDEDWINAGAVLKKGCDFISISIFTANTEANKVCIGYPNHLMSYPNHTIN